MERPDDPAHERCESNSMDLDHGSPQTESFTKKGSSDSMGITEQIKLGWANGVLVALNSSIIMSRSLYAIAAVALAAKVCRLFYVLRGRRHCFDAIRTPKRVSFARGPGGALPSRVATRTLSWQTSWREGSKLPGAGKTGNDYLHVDAGFFGAAASTPSRLRKSLLMLQTQRRWHTRGVARFKKGFRGNPRSSPRGLPASCARSRRHAEGDHMKSRRGENVSVEPAREGLQ